MLRGLGAKQSGWEEIWGVLLEEAQEEAVVSEWNQGHPGYRRSDCQKPLAP